MSKKTWFNVAKTFVKAVQNENNRIKKTKTQNRARNNITNIKASVPLDISISINNTSDDGKEYVYGMSNLPENKKYTSMIKAHIGKLANFYREHATSYIYKEDENSTLNILRELFPNANQHTCPYCGVIHTFTAARARKCPDCDERMVVRQGVFLSEDQITKLSKAVTNYYDKASLVSELKNSIEQAQSYASCGNYGRAFLSIAGGYQNCAALYNKRYEGGYSAWDFSWRILNHEALEIARIGASSPKELIGNGYSDVLLARGNHCLKELKYTETSATMNKYAKMAIEMFYIYLIALETVSLTDWQQDSAIKNIHIAKILGGIKNDEIKEIQASVIEHASPKPSNEIYNKVFHDVEDYVFLESDPSRLRQYIY